ncbi:lipase maturation factor family protein [Myceligenerans salitolerans]|uniref:Lipase maturation factor family protein n=1 Tax=Myceligenerans salitolerans TaxID=1230528 RepID=A0ABS3IB41_9MICO|nr:lipase maturation factor family protein [Myceligenerans salitolerans]MBO0610241.1 lipase maturation factor family protein [Myceligenerans salitolerans]
MPDWLTWWSTTDYDVAREVLQRGFGALYVVAFWAVLRQFRPLSGEHGLTPAPRLLAATTWRDGPSVFRVHYSDRFLAAVAWCGVALGGAVVVGLPQAGDWWVPVLCFGALWFGYLSVVNAGGRFHGFGWESLLCEAGFVVAFLGSAGGFGLSDGVPTPVLTILAVRWLLFRVELGAGLIKWRGDPSWRDLTALDHHHETQPMPGPFSWHAHHLPRRWHRVEVVGNHVTQLLLPWLLFLPQPFASVTGLAVVVTQGWLVVTGNFAWLNWATILLGLGVVSDGTWAWLLGWTGLPLPDTAGPAGGAGTAAVPATYVAVVSAAMLLLAVLSVRPTINLASPRQRMNASFEPFRLVNAYGAFGSMTKRRIEIVVEGTDAEDPDTGAWREYEFRGKPGDPARRPPQWAPYHLRLDWQMWFLPLGHASGWFTVLLRRLLEADPPTLRLLRTDPFGGARPRWVRAVAWHYRYTTPAERAETGHWWVREAPRVAVPPMRLDRSDRSDR